MVVIDDYNDSDNDDDNEDHNNDSDITDSDIDEDKDNDNDNYLFKEHEINIKLLSDILHSIIDTMYQTNTPIFFIKLDRKEINIGLNKYILTK